MRIFPLLLFCFAFSMCIDRPKPDIEADRNPFSPVSQVTYHLDQPGHVVAVFYDVQGRVVDTLHNGPAKSGELVLPLMQDTTVAAGVYFVRWTVGDSTVTKKIILLK